MSNPTRVVVTVTNRTMVRAILWVSAAIIAFHFLSRVSHVLTLIFASFFLALALNPVVSWMSRRLKLHSRVRATAAAYVVVIAVIIGFFLLVTPPLVRQSRDFIKQEVPSLVDNFQHQNSSLARIAHRYNLDQKLSKSANDFASNYGNFGSTILDTGKRIVGIVVSILAVLVMTFMMLVEGPYWLELAWGMMPENDRAHNKKLAYKMYKGVSGFVNGQVIISLLAGVFSFIALEIASHAIGVAINSVALAGIVAVLGLIPLFGNPISSTIVVLFCLLNNSLSLALVMLAYFIVYYFIENHTFQPYIQSRLNKLTALSVFVAALLGIAFAGFLGAIIAIPAASAIKVLVEDHFRHESGRRNIPTDLTSITTV